MYYKGEVEDNFGGHLYPKDRTHLENFIDSCMGAARVELNDIEKVHSIIVP